MRYIGDTYKFILFSTLICYGFVKLYIFQDIRVSIYDHIMIHFLIFTLCILYFYHRDLCVLTRRKLYSIQDIKKVEYKGYIVNHLVNNIYARVEGSTEWYEIDYLLTIHKHCTPIAFKNFAKENNNTVSLYNKMTYNKDESPAFELYNKLQDNIFYKKCIFTISFSIFEIIYWSCI